jgi:diacylglycerol kinase family enzyme
MHLQRDSGVSSQHSYFVLNPNAHGGFAARFQPKLIAALTARGLADNLLVTHSPAEASQMVNALPAGSRVIAIGGDGTVQNLLPSLVAGAHTLALISMGSGNDTARALGVHKLGWQAALNHALQGVATPIDLGEAAFIDDQHGHERRILFISSLTAGFDSAVNLRAVNGPRWLSGMARYLWATLGELLALRCWDMQVQIDGQILHQGPALFESTLNTASFGGGMPAMPHARIDDARLNLLLAGEIGLGQVLNLLPRLLVGWHLDQPKVQHLPYATMQLDSTLALPLAADGEYLGQTRSLQLAVRPAALPVVRYAV